MKAKPLSKVLKDLADPALAEGAQRFFKTGEGEYGAKDKFLGIRAPVLREQAKQFDSLALEELEVSIKSAFHEERLCALFILVHKYGRAGARERAAIYRFYMDNIQYVNNWDLVDSSAFQIVGAHLEDRSSRTLYKLVKSPSLWERRIAIMATLHFIRQHRFDEALELSERLLFDEEDLIHKAVGWMLREIGKRDLAVEKAFLKKHYRQMPRTMLRYAIEKFPARERKKYLQGLV